jgi:hypothetical protein
MYRKPIVCNLFNFSPSNLYRSYPNDANCSGREILGNWRAAAFVPSAARPYMLSFGDDMRGSRAALKNE